MKTLSSASLLLFLTALVIAGCSTNAQPPQQPTVLPVRTAPVTHTTRSLPIRTSGRLAPKTSMALSFKTGGVIERIFVDEGRAVKAGQVLARLDLSEIDARVQQARSSFTKAKRDAARMEALYRDSVVTLERFENTQTALEVATSALRIADFNRQYSEIRAPADARVLRRMAEPNELINPGEPVLVLGASQGWIIRIGLSDRDVVKLKLGDRATFYFDAFPGDTFRGSVSEIAEAADPMSGTFEVEVTVHDAGDRLKTGFIANVDLYPSAQAPFFYIPIEALVEANGNEGVVYGLDSEANLARKLPVRIAHILEDTLAISTGLETVATVITEGAAYLSDGIAVEVVAN